MLHALYNYIVCVLFGKAVILCICLCLIQLVLCGPSIFCFSLAFLPSLPNWLRQMVTPLEPGPAEGVVLWKGRPSLPLSPSAYSSGIVWCLGFPLWLCRFFRFQWKVPWDDQCSVCFCLFGVFLVVFLDWPFPQTISYFCYRYGVAVQDFSKSWISGLAFLAVIKSIDSSLVDMRKALLRSSRENLEDAFRIAHYSLGIPRLLEPEGNKTTATFT